ncbi:MAG: diacylglycerol kinase family protein [Patescibacteria group bacterium]
MFFYYYDAFVSDKKNEEELTKAENRLITLGINGRIEKSSVLRNAKESIEDGIKQGAHTIIAVGDDNTLTKVVNIAAEKNVTIGFIPMIKNSKFAEILGIADSLEACNILSKRLTKKINLGKANLNYFLASLNLPQSDGLQIECDEKFKISLRHHNCKLSIYNLGNFLIASKREDWKLFPGRSNHLFVSILPQSKKKFGGLVRTSNQERESIFPAKKIKITSPDISAPVILDEQTTLKTPVTVSFKPKKITFIVGRNRKI